ncbi:hypothetical protein KIH74_08885 [Kineosporia sp. J2-2]|uniref:Secreted protein n=1 Tax=Kineosporia corallincola TaxID=2835133 RepID=A0ABS5TD80_9ACTN|nr:hypothetical protein [Kineosporia corallincola]MBT0769040.1 hypothetical protein [Kineosporia corallincola]
MENRMFRTALLGVGVVLLTLAGCGESAAAATDEQRERALAAGFDVDQVYVLELDAYHLAAGGNGVYGDSGYQAVYASAQGDDLRLTVERAGLDDDTCPALPVPGAEGVGVTVECTRDDDGWRRVADDREEYALVRDGLLVRVSGIGAVAGSGLIRQAALDARPATEEELDDLLPPLREVVERGDISGDSAPDNGVGAGG